MRFSYIRMRGFCCIRRPDLMDISYNCITDLKTMSKRVESEQYYVTFEMFFADVRRMFSNARTYNSNDTIYYKCSTRQILETLTFRGIVNCKHGIRVFVFISGWKIMFFCLERMMCFPTSSVCCVDFFRFREITWIGKHGESGISNLVPWN